MSILHPLTPRLTTRHSLLVILGIWAVSLVITSPDMAIIQYEANISSGAQCFVCELVILHRLVLHIHSVSVKQNLPSKMIFIIVKEVYISTYFQFTFQNEIHNC